MNVVAGELIVGSQMTHPNSSLDIRESDPLLLECPRSPSILILEGSTKAVDRDLSRRFDLSQLFRPKRLIAETPLTPDIVPGCLPGLDVLMLDVSLGELLTVFVQEHCNDCYLVEGAPPSNRPVRKA